MKSIDDVKTYLKERIKKEKECIIGYKQIIAKAFASDGLYFGGRHLDDVDSCVRSYTYHRTKLNELNRIYEDLFGKLEEEE